MSDTTQIEKSVENPWKRLLFIILFGIIFNIVEFVVWVLVVVQFLTKLFTGEVNKQLQLLGTALGAYAGQIIEFLTYYSDDRPYPFRPWSSGAQTGTTSSNADEESKPDLAKKVPTESHKDTPES